MRSSLRIAIPIAVGVLLTAGGLVDVLSHRQPRLAGSNALVEISARALVVAPGSQLCAGRESIPAGTAGARVFVGTFGRRGGPIALFITAGGRPVATGRVRGGFANNAALRIPLPRIRRDVFGATVCLRNLGRRKMQFAGNRTPIAGDRPAGPEEIRFDWLLPDRPSGWDVAPRVAARFPLFKVGVLGSWSFWALGIAVCGLWAAAIALYLRQAR